MLKEKKAEVINLIILVLKLFTCKRILRANVKSLEEIFAYILQYFLLKQPLTMSQYSSLLTLLHPVSVLLSEYDPVADYNILRKIFPLLLKIT